MLISRGWIDVHREAIIVGEIQCENVMIKRNDYYVAFVIVLLMYVSLVLVNDICLMCIVNI